MTIVVWQVMLPWRQMDDSSRVQYRLIVFYYITTTNCLLGERCFSVWLLVGVNFGPWVHVVLMRCRVQRTVRSAAASRPLTSFAFQTLSYTEVCAPSTEQEVCWH